MKKSSLITVILLLILLVTINTIGLASNLPFEEYKQGLKALKYQEWEQAMNYFDEIILNDLSHSNYMAKSIYLKTIILAAQTERALELNSLFLNGEEQISFEEKEVKEEFHNIAANYRLQAKRDVDTLIGLANYLVANLPPLKIDLNKLNFNRDYNENLTDKIRSGVIISDKELKRLEDYLLIKKINKYLRLTLGVKAFNNYYITTAEDGDTLHKLSKKYEVPLSLLVGVNDQIEDPDKIYPDQNIYIPKMTQSYINYPAYFYYISHLSYQANRNRKEDITRLVLKAYQLTNRSKKVDQDFTDESKELLRRTRDDKYEQMIKIQSREIETQKEEIKIIKKKYDRLLSQLQEMKTELEEKKDKKERVRENEYDLADDPLDY